MTKRTRKTRTWPKGQGRALPERPAVSARGACSVEIARDCTRVGAVSKLLGGGHDRHRAQHWRGVGVWLCAVVGPN